MILPDKVKFLIVDGLGHVEYWFRNDVWECVSFTRGLKFMEGFGFQQAEQECQRRKLKFCWKPQTRKFAREKLYPADPKYDHLFDSPNHGETPHL